MRTREIRHLRHAPTCPTGARAEQRGACTCGAATRPAAFTLRIREERCGDGRALVDLEAPQPLTWIEVFALGQALEAVQLETGRRWAGPSRPARARCGCGAELDELLADCSKCSAGARESAEGESE